MAEAASRAAAAALAARKVTAAVLGSTVAVMEAEAEEARAALLEERRAAAAALAAAEAEVVAAGTGVAALVAEMGSAEDEVADAQVKLKRARTKATALLSVKDLQIEEAQAAVESAALRDDVQLTQVDSAEKARLAAERGEAELRAQLGELREAQRAEHEAAADASAVRAGLEAELDEVRRQLRLAEMRQAQAEEMLRTAAEQERRGRRGSSSPLQAPLSTRASTPAAEEVERVLEVELESNAEAPRTQLDLPHSSPRQPSPPPRQASPRPPSPRPPSPCEPPSAVDPLRRPIADAPPGAASAPGPKPAPVRRSWERERTPAAAPDTASVRATQPARARSPLAPSAAASPPRSPRPSTPPRNATPPPAQPSSFPPPGFASRAPPHRRRTSKGHVSPESSPAREQAWQELQEARTDPTEAGLPVSASPNGSVPAARAERAEGAEDDLRRLLLAERARADSQQREIDELRSRDAAALGLRAEVRAAKVTAAADGAMRASAERRAAAAEEEAAAARRDAQEARREVAEQALLLRQLRSSARAMATVAERAKRAEREARLADGLETPPMAGGLPGVEEEASAEAEAETRAEARAEAGAKARVEAPSLRRGSTSAAVVAAAGQDGELVKPLLVPQPLDEAAMLEATLLAPEGGGGGSADLVERDLAALRADMRGFERLRARSVGGAPPQPLLLAAMDAVASAGEDAFARLLQRELRTPAETALLAGLLRVRLPPPTPPPHASSLNSFAPILQPLTPILQPRASILQPGASRSSRSSARRAWRGWARSAGCRAPCGCARRRWRSRRSRRSQGGAWARRRRRRRRRWRRRRRRRRRLQRQRRRRRRLGRRRSRKRRLGRTCAGAARTRGARALRRRRKHGGRPTRRGRRCSALATPHEGCRRRRVPPHASPPPPRTPRPSRASARAATAPREGTPLHGPAGQSRPRTRAAAAAAAAACRPRRCRPTARTLRTILPTCSPRGPARRRLRPVCRNSSVGTALPTPRRLPSSSTM